MKSIKTHGGKLSNSLMNFIFYCFIVTHATLRIRFLLCNNYRTPTGSFRAGPDLSSVRGEFP